jgi:formiminoglutamase
MFQNWLRHLPADLPTLKPYQFGEHLLRYTGTGLPDLSDTQLAIIGIGDKDADTVRDAFYQLSYPYEGLQVADLGNVRKKSTSFLIPLVVELLESKIFPIIIGARAEYALAQYKAFQTLQYLINLTIVDEQIAYSQQQKDKSFFLNEIVNHPQSRLFHLNFIGAQGHFAEPDIFDSLDEKYFDHIRLGKAKANLNELEPLIRDGDLLSINLSALKATEAPGVSQPSPSGFTVEEACQITRYAGMSDKLKTFGIYGYQQKYDHQKQGAMAVAQMIWYFLDGFYNRKGDYPVSTEGLTEYIVEYKSLDYQLTFWRSEKSGRWWMQVPVKSKSKYQRHRLVPCSYNDYLLACQDELPERLLNALRRFG